MRASFVARIALLAAVAVLGSGAGGATAAGTPSRAVLSANALESQVLAELNAVRHVHGLTPLRLSRPLSAAAEAHSRSMGRFGYFAHESRDGSEFWKRVKRFYGSNGFASWSVGENLLWASPTVGADRALELWLASPGHRKNILAPGWREIGLAAVTVNAASGVYGGRDVTIITTDFGTRS